jgi:hypothetical protein
MNIINRNGDRLKSPSICANPELIILKSDEIIQRNALLANKKLRMMIVPEA